MSWLISDEASPCSEWMLIFLNCNCSPINTNYHLSVMYDSGRLIVLSSPLTTVTDNQDIIVGCWLALHRVAWCGLLQMFKGTFSGSCGILRLDTPPCVWAALWCLAPTSTWHHASVHWPDELSLSFNFGDCFYYILTFCCTALMRRWRN